MKTRIISLGLTIVLLLSVAACSGQSEETETSGETETSEETDTAKEETTGEEEETSETDSSSDTAITFESADAYSEGLAWIKFSKDTDDYYGVINKAGELVFAINYCDESAGNDSFIDYISQFSNGYSFVMYAASEESSLLDYWHKVIVVNTEGEITAEYSLTEDYYIDRFGDGYIMTEEYSGDYYSETYVYTIYSPEGEELWTYETDERASTSYDSDNGIFECDDQKYAVDVYDYSDYPESSYPERTVEVDTGADGNRYVILYDSSGSQVSEPIEFFDYGSYRYNESRLFVFEADNSFTVLDVHVYDEDGSYLYSLSEAKYSTISYYSDGAALVSNYSEYSDSINLENYYSSLASTIYGNSNRDFMLIANGEEPAYLDLNGDLLFDSIDMSAFYE